MATSPGGGSAPSAPSAVADRIATPAAHRDGGGATSSTAREPPIDIQKLQSNNPATWGDGLRQYEYGNRHVIHPDKLKQPEIQIKLGQMREQERIYDPLLQKYRDWDKEKGQRVLEERCRVSHLNRAKDIQLLRENNFDIVNNASKLSGLGDEIADKGLRPTKVGKRKFPDSFYDYNILSNLPVSIHHPDRPEARPLPAQKLPKQRMVPAFLQKDFNILTNRYLNGHAEKTKRDHELNLLEGTAKYRTRSRMNPLTQRFLDPVEEDRFAQFGEAHEVEQVHRALAQVPPTVKNRPSAFYNILNPHEVHDVDMIKWLDLAEDERKERYKNKFIFDHNKHVQDVRGDQITEERRMNKVHVQRFKEPIDRAYDIVTNEHTHGRNGKPLYLPYPHNPPGPWERSIINTIDTRLEEQPHPSKMREAATSSAVMNADDGQRSSASSQRAPEQGATQGIQQEGSGRRGATRSSSSSAVGSSARSAAASSARSSARMHEKSIQPVVRPHAVKHNHATVVKEMGIQPLNMQKVQSQKSAVDNLVAGATQLGNGGAGAMTMTIPMKAPPPAPAIPGSAVGSNVSRPV